MADPKDGEELDRQGEDEELDNEEGQKPSDTGEDEDDQSESDDSDKPDGKDGESKKDEEEADVDESQIPRRQPLTAKDHIIRRKTRKIEKLQAPTDDEDEDDDEGELDPDDRKEIHRATRETLNPVLNRIEERELKADIRAFVAENPDFKGFEKRILAWAKVHPTMPVESLAYAIRGKELMERSGAKRQQTAARAKDNQIPSTTGGRTTPKAPDFDKMSDDDVEKFAMDVKTGKVK